MGLVFCKFRLDIISLIKTGKCFFCAFKRLKSIKLLELKLFGLFIKILHYLIKQVLNEHYKRDSVPFWGDNYLSVVIIANNLVQPTITPATNSYSVLLGFAFNKVLHAFFVPKKAVVSYTTFSPLPKLLQAVYFLCHFLLSLSAQLGVTQCCVCLKSRLSSTAFATAIIRIRLTHKLQLVY